MGGVDGAAFSPDGDSVIVTARRGAGRRLSLHSDAVLDTWEGALDCVEAAHQRHPLRARGTGEGTLIEQVSTGDRVALFPVALDNIVTHPDGLTWAGTDGSRVYIFCLEGAPPGR